MNKTFQNWTEKQNITVHHQEAWADENTEFCKFTSNISPAFHSILILLIVWKKIIDEKLDNKNRILSGHEYRNLHDSKRSTSS